MKSKLGKTLLKELMELFSVLSCPFKKDFLYMIIVWLLLTLPSLYHEPFIQMLYISLFYYVLVYVITCLCDLNQIASQILKPIFFAIVYFFCLLNVFCIKWYYTKASSGIINILKESNLNEISEYIQTYLSTSRLILFIILIIIGIVLYISTLKFKINFKKNTQRFFVLVALFGIIFLSFNLRLCNQILISIVGDQGIDLRNHLTNPNIILSDSLPPQNIVIIIGESFNKSHSSLYGYDKETNPLLEQLNKTADLLVYNNIKTPKTHTTDVFRYILNTYHLGHEKECKWYETPTLIEVLNKSNYFTIWLSNQEEKGIYDNLPSSYSKICTEYIFTSKDSTNTKFDDRLLNYTVKNANKNNAIFYHLMGQHISFKERYPDNFKIFKSYDYNLPSNQAKIIAEYDNATLYNDYVVNSIIDKYRDTDAIVFYFSDHSLDLFDTDPEYFGHAKNTEESQQAAEKIPFMIYISPKFQELRPELTNRLKNAVNKEFCTDKLIYSVMDVAGIKFKENNDVSKYSLFNQ